MVQFAAACLRTPSVIFSLSFGVLLIVNFFVADTSVSACSSYAFLLAFYAEKELFTGPRAHNYPRQDSHKFESI